VRTYWKSGDDQRRRRCSPARAAAMPTRALMRSALVIFARVLHDAVAEADPIRLGGEPGEPTLRIFADDMQFHVRGPLPKVGASAMCAAGRGDGGMKKCPRNLARD